MLTLFESLKVSMVKFAKPSFHMHHPPGKRYKDCHRFSEYSNQILISWHCLTTRQRAGLSCVKLRHESDLLTTNHLLYSTLTLPYRKAQKFFDGTKRIDAKVE